MKCTYCDGERRLHFAFRPFSTPCPLCDGRGDVPNDTPHRQELGKRCRQIRINNDMTIRDFHKEFHVSTLDLSKYEMGAYVSISVSDKIESAIERLESKHRRKGGE